MRIVVFLLLVLILISPAVIAAQGSGKSNKSESQSGQGQEVQVAHQNMARNVTELKQMIQEKQQEMNQEMKNLTKQQQKVYKNQNAVRLAVHTLLSMENLTGGIGKNVSQIAREFNNSMQATIKAEERIQKRSQIMKFFFGGDKNSSEEIEQELNQSQYRLEQLKQFRQECNCTAEVKAMLQEQIQNIEQEQNRLQELVRNEKQSKGLFGLFLGWFKK